MKALITTGGHGTRLRPITHTKNKHLIPVANKPIVFYALEAVKEAGITEVGVVTRGEGKDIQEALGSGEQWGLDITYVPQEAPLGLAHVVKISEDFVGGERFVFYLGDNMVVGGIRRFVAAFERENSNCHLILAKVKDPQRFGVPEFRDGRIVAVEEKPANPKSDFAVSGIYLYDEHIFEAVNNIKPSSRGELEISDAHQYLLDHGYTISFSQITGWWKDTGKPADLLEANRLVLDHMIEPKIEGEVGPGSDVVGKVRIGKGSRILSSNVRGPAIIGKDVVIENSYVGPYTSIYDRCIIRNSEVEYSILLEECQLLDVGLRVEGSLLGDDVRIVDALRKPRTHRLMVGDQSRIEIA